MSERQEAKIDPNQADEESLERLPGVGPALARRIVAGRPYAAAEDLLRVPGVGPALLARMRPMLTFAPAAQGGAQARRAPMQEAGKAAAGSPPAVGTPPSRPTQAPARANFVSRAQALWLTGAASALTFVLAVAFSLGLVAAVNGTLAFSSRAKVQALEARSQGLEGQLSSLAAKLKAMDQRLAALEGLSGRMVELEQDLEAMRGQVEGAHQALALQQETLDGLQQEVDAVRGSAQRFEDFLQGLGRLLVGLLEDSGAQAP